MSLVRFLMLLALVVWVGGIIFFAFVVAPSLFVIVPSQHVAGLVVARCLTSLHWIGMVAGVVFVLCSLVAGGRLFKNGLVLAMLLLTAILQFGIVRSMEQLRTAAGGDISALPQSDPARHRFDTLHNYSTKIEGAVLLLGLAATWLVARDGEAKRELSARTSVN